MEELINILPQLIGMIVVGAFLLAFILPPN
jgi:hypothetical protein